MKTYFISQHFTNLKLEIKYKFLSISNSTNFVLIIHLVIALRCKVLWISSQKYGVFKRNYYCDQFQRKYSYYAIWTHRPSTDISSSRFFAHSSRERIQYPFPALVSRFRSIHVCIDAKKCWLICLLFYILLENIIAKEYRPNIAQAYFISKGGPCMKQVPVEYRLNLGAYDRDPLKFYQ